MPAETVLTVGWRQEPLELALGGGMFNPSLPPQLTPRRLAEGDNGPLPQALV
ncbi:MAG: hypothetical protein RLZZ54_1565 [Cyanobacteriota bacterium]|jgi:hypothetical protein